MNKDEFEKIVEESLKSLPENYRKIIENLEVIIEDLPSKEVCKNLELDSPYELFGLYHGISQDRRGPFYGNALPDIIYIYQKSLERAFGNTKKLKDEIRETVIHEIGHYFGLEDENLW